MMAAKASGGRFRRTGRSLWRRFATQFALLAIALQVLVVQPHIEPAALGAVHAEATITGRSVAGGVVAKADAQEAAAVCIICQAALAGRTVIATSADPAPVERQALNAATPLPQAPILSATPSHAWRSRGQPSLI
jgi:hypothetical protein